MKLSVLAAAAAVAVSTPCITAYSADCTKIGYGQGTAVDSRNVPVDAAEFTSRYGDLDACALSGDDNRIVITFDQGYENGYTAKILDTLKEKMSAQYFSLPAIMPKRKRLLFSE